jgi:hypothetical protein
MQEEKCAHQWSMINVQTGLIITENCFKCDKTSTYFCLEQNPPLEEYREGDHFWNVMESAQAIRFDLQCTHCNTVETLQELAGLMMCTGCDENCKVDHIRKELEKDRIWVYVAFGFLPVDEVEQLSLEKISILEEYFNQRRRSSKSSIKIVPSDLISDIKNCYAEIIKDTGMLDLKPAGE